MEGHLAQHCSSIVFTVYSIGIYYNGKAHYLAILVFIEDMAGLSYINWMPGKAKLTHLFVWKMNQKISVYLWHFRSVLDLLCTHQELELCMEWDASPYVCDIFLGSATHVLFSHSSLDRERGKKTIQSQDIIRKLSSCEWHEEDYLNPKLLLCIYIATASIKGC